MNENSHFFILIYSKKYILTAFSTVNIGGSPGRTDRSRGTADDERAGQEEEREEKVRKGEWRREQQGEGQETEG